MKIKLDGMAIEVIGNLVRMTHDFETGYEFETKVNYIKENKISHTVSYVYDKGREKRLKSPKLTRKYQAWISSILWNCSQSGIIPEEVTQ